MGRIVNQETAPQQLWENCSKEAGGELRLYTSFQQWKQAVCTSKIRHQVKECSILCMGKCKPLDSLNSFLSFGTQLSGAKSYFLVHLASCISLTPQQLPWTVAASFESQFREPSITFGGQKLLIAGILLVYWYDRRYFHFTIQKVTNLNSDYVFTYDYADLSQMRKNQGTMAYQEVWRDYFFNHWH